MQVHCAGLASKSFNEDYNRSLSFTVDIDSEIFVSSAKM